MDESYYPLLCESNNPLVSNGVFPFSEPVLVSYMDLDMLIEQAKLSKVEHKVVGWLMQGYREDDIAEHYGTTLGKIKQLFAVVVDKIVAANNKNEKFGGIFKVGEEF